MKPFYYDSGTLEKKTHGPIPHLTQQIRSTPKKPKFLMIFVQQQLPLNINNMKLLYHIIEKHNFSSMPWLKHRPFLNSVSKLGIFHVIAAVGEINEFFGCTKKTSNYSHNSSLLSFSFQGNCNHICLCGGVHSYLLNVDGWDVFVSFQTRKLHPPRYWYTTTIISTWR